MLALPIGIVPILAPFAMLFTNPTWRKAQLLLVGAILTTGQRTVAAALQVMGRSDHDGYARYHEVLNRAVWSPREGARILVLLLLQYLDRGDSPLVFGVRSLTNRETLERRRGAKIRARGIYRDAVRSSRHQLVKSSPPEANATGCPTDPWPGTTVPPAWWNLSPRPPSGTARASLPSPSAGCWSAPPRGLSILRPCSPPTQQQTRPRSFSGLSCVGPPLAEGHLPGSAHPSRDGNPASVVRPRHRPHHPHPAGPLLLDHPGRPCPATRASHHPPHCGLARSA